MSDYLLITDKADDWPDVPSSLPIVTAKSYLNVFLPITGFNFNSNSTNTSSAFLISFAFPL